MSTAQGTITADVVFGANMSEMCLVIAPCMIYNNGINLVYERCGTMKRAVSILTAVILAIVNLNVVIAFAEDLQPIAGKADAGKYTWVLGNEDVSGNGIYDYSDEYGAVRVSIASSDRITASDGIFYSGAACGEGSGDNVTTTGRYILLKPTYSGTLSITAAFASAGGSRTCRVYSCDLGQAESFETIDLTKLYKGNGTVIIGATSSGAAIGTMEMEAGHAYGLYTYNSSTCSISQLSYTSDSIVGKTAAPTIQTPVLATDTEILGTCIDGAVVSVAINGGEARTATVTGNEWSLPDVSLNIGDIISVTAKAGEDKESDAATATVEANDSICAVTINDTQNGTVTTNQSDNTRIKKGSTVVLTATPADKYKLSSLTVAGNVVEVDKNNQYSFVINADTTVSAEFTEKPYHSITIPASVENGTIAVSGGTIDENGTIKAVEGDKVTFSVKADEGYRIKTLSYTCGADTEEFKYSNSFVMPTGDVVVSAEFKKEALISKVDTSFDTYDKLTMTVDGEPFFYNGIQVRPDNAKDQKGYTDAQIEDMYQKAADNGFTVVNSQIRWHDVQPDTYVAAADTGYIKGGSNSSTALSGDKTVMYSAYDENALDNQSISYIKFALPELTDGGEYAAVKLRLRVTDVTAGTGLSIYGISDHTWSGETMTWDNTASHNGYEITNPDYKITSLGWDEVTAAGYFGFDVTDFVNQHKNDDYVSFAVLCDSESTVTIAGAADTTADSAPLLRLSRDDVYDWTYLDKIIGYAEKYGLKFEVLWFATDTCQVSHEGRVPYYVHNNYQKSLKSDGTPARNMGALNSFIMCKNDLDLRAKEKEVLEAVFDHIAEYNRDNGSKNTVVGCQVANEPAVARLHSGTDENKYFTRCYCDNCVKKYNECVENTTTEARALYAYYQETMWDYLNNLSSAVKESNYSVWTRVNNYMGTDANVIAYNEEKRVSEGTDLDMVGLDPYSVNSGSSNEYLYSFGHESSTYKNHTCNYGQGSNVPMVMEYGGNNAGVANSIIACIAGGGVFNIYELLSGKEDFGIYTDPGHTGEVKERIKDGVNVVESLKATNNMLNKVKYDLASKKSDGAGGNTLLFFNPISDNTENSTKQVRALDVTYHTSNNGVGIAMEKSEKEMVLLSTSESEFAVDDIKEYGITAIETGYYDGDTWVKEADKPYTENGEGIRIDMNAYECVKLTVTEAIPKAPVIEAVSGTAETGKYTWSFGTPEQAQGKGAYDYSDDYASVRVATGMGDSVTAESGIYFSDSSCKETDSAQDSNRYVLVTPAYSGKLSLKIGFAGATTSGKGRLWYYDYGENTAFDTADTSILKKKSGDQDIGQVQIGSDFTNTEARIESFDVTAGHTYAIYTYNKGSYISGMYYESEDITVAPPPVDDMPVTLKDITVAEDGTLQASLAYSGQDNMGTVMLIAAVYSSGTMEKANVFTVSAEGDIDFHGYIVDNNKELKLFVWNSLDDMKPMSRIYTNEEMQ